MDENMITGSEETNETTTELENDSVETELENDTAVTEVNNDTVVTEDVMNNEMTQEAPLYRGVPEDSPYSPMYNPNKGKKDNRLTMVMLGLLLIVLVVALIAAVSKLVETATQEMSVTGKSFESFIEEQKEKLVGADESEDYDTTAESAEDYFSSTEEDYVPSAEDEYYVTFVDDIRDDASYTVDVEEYYYEDADKNVEIYISYPVITSGDIPNSDHINEYVEEAANYYMKNYANNPEDGNVTDCYINVESYVTKMGEDYYSIVLREDFEINQYFQLDLFCINVDVATGQILTNEDFLDYTEELGSEFRKLSDYQNGQSDAVDSLSDEELADFLSDPDSCIAFFTPVGMEIGFNYTYDESSGWITATLKDYEDYMSRM